MEDSFIIKNLLEQPEGERLELKASIDYDAIAKVITSFINTKGGDLLIGVNEDKTVSDIEIDEFIKSRITEFLIRHIKPTAPIFANVFSYKKRKVMLISVWEGSNKPYFFENTIYVRQGTQTKRSSEKAISALLNQQVDSEQRWERQAVLGASLLDLDINEIEKSLQDYKGYNSDSTIDGAESFLVSRGLIVNGNITNACMLLFGENPTRFIPQAKIKLVVYPGNSPGDTFIENKHFEGNIFRNIEQAFTHFESIFGKEIRVEGAFRTDKDKYPKKALREGLLNAIVHRDYSASKSFLTISAFSNKMVISNYGGLPKELTVKDLKSEHNSILRNPDVAQMCFYRGYIEMLGTGTLRMIRDCKAQGYKVPSWTNKNNILELTFPDLSHQFEGVNEGARLNLEGVNEGVKLNIEGVNEGVKLEIELLYNQIVKHPGKKASELNEQIEKSVASTERYLKILKENGYVEFRGAPKTGGYYKIK